MSDSINYSEDIMILRAKIKELEDRISYLEEEHRQVFFTKIKEARALRAKLEAE